ncbi:unnamed protein product [Knipowitschia caucasica]|uniref:Uncharacterized protein n=1 Tax=Knipowitschia caucasica TaxID=637954 RepID=A0AAV2MFM1_KNICA
MERPTWFLCELVQSRGETICAHLLPEECVSTEAFLSIELQQNLSTVHVQDMFEPSQCIRPRSPLAPVLVAAAELWNITWTSGYEHSLLSEALEFELLLQNTADLCSSDSCKSHVLSCQSPHVLVEASKLEPESLLCARVRSRPSHQDYSGVWSHWSPQTCRTSHRTGQSGQLVIGALCVLLLMVLSVSTVRFWMKIKTPVPSPAPFFKPLFCQYDGRLKEWISAPCSSVLDLDMFPTTFVMVECFQKDPEPPEVPGPVFSLELPCADSSYVGVEDLPSPTLLSRMCPGSGSSYIQLPLSNYAD